MRQQRPFFTEPPLSIGALTGLSVSRLRAVLRLKPMNTIEACGGFWNGQVDEGSADLPGLYVGRGQRVPIHLARFCRTQYD